MGDGPVTRSRTSSRNSTERSWARGITLVELLVAVAVSGLLLALVLPLVLSSRRIVERDQVRTAVNQTLRAAHDLVSSDVRVAGERFGDIGRFQLSPVELRRTADGSELVLRRFLVEVLPVCERDALRGAQAAIKVADLPGAGGPPTTLPDRCVAPRAVIDANGRAWPPNVFAWREYLGPGGRAMAYIYQPDAGIGQWFPVAVRSSSTMQVHCVPSVGSCSWSPAAQYSLLNNSFIALMQEISYRVQDGVLLRVDEATGEAMRIADGIDAFDVRITLDDGTVADTFGATQSWTTIRSIDVSLRAEIGVGPRAVDRVMQVAYFPRNVLSR